MKAHVDASPTKACVLFEDGNREFAEAKAVYTNNEAEYRAILFAIHISKIRHFELTEIVSDSQLVVKQLTGKNKIKESRLGELAVQVWKKVGANYQVIGGMYKLVSAGRVKFTWVRKEENPAGRELE